MIGKLDQIIARSLRKLAEDTHVRSWCAKEHDWVNYFAHSYLLGECSPRGPLKEAGQIGIDVAVPQPPGCGYDKQSVGRDLVIWPKCGDTCLMLIGKPANILSQSWNGKSTAQDIQIGGWNMSAYGSEITANGSHQSLPMLSRSMDDVVLLHSIVLGSLHRQRMKTG